MKLLPHTAVVALVLGIRDRYRTGRTAFLAVDRVLNAINALPSATEWQSIETAPKNELILVGPTKRMGICAAMNHSQDGWVTETCSDWVSIYTPKHWQPLPAPPETCQDKEL